MTRDAPAMPAPTRSSCRITGGRQLDGAIAPLRVLPEVVAACPGYPVMLDGGRAAREPMC